MSSEVEDQHDRRTYGRRALLWAALVFAIAAATLARRPLLTHAEAHLDSDLAVDGLTLSGLLQGHWRWHFPGTPRIGIAPLILCVPQAMLRGVNAATLTSGGLVAYALVIVAAFLLARRAFGDRVALWGLIPLAFSSNGAVWLSSRLTGGHLLAVAWHAAAFALLYSCLKRGGWKRCALLGIFSGIGLYVDAMFMFTLLGFIPAAFWSAIRNGIGRRSFIGVAGFFAGLAIGFAPAWIGAQVDPRDDYPDQFSPTFMPELLWGHANIFAMECLPRLISGRLLPDLRTEPDPRVAGGIASALVLRREPIFAGVLCVLSLALFVVGLAFLTVDPDARRLPRVDKTPREAVRLGIAVASIGVVIAFLINLHIYNSDNYRYLVYLLIPWSLGFGLTMDFMSRRGLFPAAIVLATTFATLSALDEKRWLEGLGWMGADRVAVARPTTETKIRDWLKEHPEVDYIVSDYWLVYRLAFLTRGKIKGRPYGAPNRFPEWGDGGDRAGRRVLILIPLARDWPPFEGTKARREARAAGGKLLGRVGGVGIYSWPPKSKSP